MKDFASILGSHKDTATRLIAQCIELGYLYKVEKDGYYASTDLVRRVKPLVREQEQLAERGLYVTAFNRYSVRAVYDAWGATPTFGYIVRLVPYLNRDYNILCWSQLSAFHSRYKPLRRKDVCQLIGAASDTPRSALDVARNMRKMSFISPYTNELEALVSVYYNNGTPRTERFVYNTDFCYGGEYWDDARALGHFDKLAAELNSQAINNEGDNEDANQLQS